ncbi:MAG: ribonuclease E/G, partial [Rhodospirillales bacterium]
AVLPGLKAAFIDIGQEADGFLPQQDARWLTPDKPDAAITALVREGQALLLQVQRDAESSKGPRLTADIGLGGRLLVLRPRGTDVQLSRKITADETRTRLQDSLTGLAGDRGWIVRTEAASADSDQVVQEAEDLIRKWQDIENRAGNLKAPAVLDSPNKGLAGCLQRLGLAGVTRITVDGDATAAALQDIRPASDIPVGICRTAGGPLETGGADAQIEMLTGAEAPLAGGGLIRIERTAAATTIDVDTAAASGGNGAPARHRVNEAAAREIPRQLRLRNIGGVILIDFILDRDRKPADSIITSLRAGFRQDPEQPHVTGLTPSGLVEVVRRRSGPTLTERLTSPGRATPSPVTMALDALKSVLRQVRSDPSFRPTLRAERRIIDLYRGDLAGALQETERALKFPLPLSVDDQSVGRIEIDQI